MASVDNLIRRKKAKEKERQTYINRKTAVENIITDINKNGCFDDDIKSCNDVGEDVCDEIYKAIKGEVTSLGNIEESVIALQEKYPSSDDHLVSVDANLNEEKKRCEGKIKELEDEIAAIEEQIQNALASEKE